MTLAQQDGLAGAINRDNLAFRRRALLVCGSVWAVLLLLLVPNTALAQSDDSDKSGVTPQVISLPSGPGSLEGLGESFQPELSTGTGSYAVTLEAPPGVAGFQPDLVLRYDGGNANGPWGMGWQLNVPYVQRQTDEGLPAYDDGVDRFIYSGGEKLARVGERVYRFENEGGFMRFRRLESGGWEAHSPDGTRSIFGEDENGKVTNEFGSFRWHLQRQLDTHGNEIRYIYLHDGGYAYLREVRYNFSSDGRYNSVVFTYEPRPDFTTDRRSRTPVSIALRSSGVQMWALGQLVRSYRFEYAAERSTGMHSLLEQVTLVGDDGSSEMPSTTFGYSQFDVEAYEVVSMQSPPPLSLLNPDADLVDINGDSLPDVVYTPGEGHRFYLNRGNGRWQPGPVYSDPTPGDRLSSPSTRMADMDGNGQADLLVKAGNTPSASFYYYAGHAGEQWRPADRIDYHSNPNFSLDDPNLRLFDANNDKRVDMMLTTDSQYYVWLAQEDNTWNESADSSAPALSVGTPLVFSDARVKVADMTGDRLQDLVFIRDGLVVYFPHNGNADYGDAVEMADPPVGIGDLENALLLGDLNNDGLADMVLPGNGSVRYWLNRGDHSFAPAVVLSGTPGYNLSNTAVRLADMDGDGAAELLFSRYPAPEDEAMQYVDFYTGTQPLLLHGVDNGLGRTIQIQYKPSTHFYTGGWDAGMPWQTTLPFPVQVVSRVTVHDANSGDEYVVDYSYGDGYYDGAEKEFRGFARAEQVDRGDETAPTTATRAVFDTGREEESRKGLLLERFVLGEGGACEGGHHGCYRREVNTLETQVLNDGSDGRRVTYSFVGQTDTYVHEGQTAYVQLRQEFKRDEYGNLIEAFDYGRVCDGDVTCGGDELLTYREYARNLDAWILDRPSRVYRTDADGNVVSDVRSYYDGEEYVGLPAGEVVRGDLSRQEASLGPAGDSRFVPVRRQAYDEYGNVTGIMDANGNRTTVAYDPLVHTFPVLERLHLGDGRSLSYAASYHVGFGAVTAATDYNGNVSHYTYDPFGRIEKIVQPGDTLALPTQQFSYDLGSPRSAITTRKRERLGTENVRTSVEYFDGLGRKLQGRGEAEDGRVVVSEAVTFNARKKVRDQYLPYFDDGLAYVPPDATQAHTRRSYDPLLRVVRTDNPDSTFSTVVHKPLEEVHYDEEDNIPGSPHANTPKTFLYDGLERLAGVQERNRVDGMEDVYETGYEYDPLGNLTWIVDAQGNVKRMAYDALSRKVYMDDPDQGEMYYRYDDAGNLVETQDAKGQVVRYTYDAANRPVTEEWVRGDGEVETVVTYHYDGDLAPTHLDARNTMGQLSYIEDREGAVFFSYDDRGNVAGRIRRFDDEGLAFTTLMQYDAMDRLAEVTYADGTVVEYEYSAQGLLERLPGIVEDVDYTASGQQSRIVYANSVVKNFEYDERQRLRHLDTQGGDTTLQDLRYTFDGASNVVSIDDARPDRHAANDQNQDFTYDSLYRLTRAEGLYGEIEYGYDAIGNIVGKTSTVDEPGLNPGEIRYGENGAGPHALTFAGGEEYRYDANGNLVQTGDVVYSWDHRDRLVSVKESERTSSYAYDASGQRIRQIVDEGGEVTRILYPDRYIEVRGDELVRYVFAGDERVTKVTAPFEAETLIRGFQPTGRAGLATEGERLWYVSDHLASIQLLLDNAGQVQVEAAYYPYGLTRHETTAGEAPYRFTGRELDVSGLYYFGARYYNPLVAQFTNPDPLYTETPERGQETPVVLNTYAYGAGNPVNVIDVAGLQPSRPNRFQIPEVSYNINGHRLRLPLDIDAGVPDFTDVSDQTLQQGYTYEVATQPFIGTDLSNLRLPVSLTFTPLPAAEAVPVGEPYSIPLTPGRVKSATVLVGNMAMTAYNRTGATYREKQTYVTQGVLEVSIGGRKVGSFGSPDNPIPFTFIRTVREYEKKVDYGIGSGVGFTATGADPESPTHILQHPPVGLDQGLPTRVQKVD